MLMANAKTCIQAAYDCFQERFNDDLAITLSAFKYACYFEPTKIGELKPSAADLDDMNLFTLLASDGQLDGMTAELHGIG